MHMHAFNSILIYYVFASSSHKYKSEKQNIFIDINYQNANSLNLNLTIIRSNFIKIHLVIAIHSC